MKPYANLIVALLGLGNLAVANPGDSAGQFKITTGKKDDVVEVQVAKDKTLFAIKSPFGISQAVIERTEAKWPKVVMVRLHLKGLESFRAANANVKLDAAVTFQEGKLQVRIWKDGKENAPLDKTSPLWMDIRAVGGD